MDSIKRNLALPKKSIANRSPMTFSLQVFVFVAFLLVAISAARGEETVLEFKGLDLLGNIEIANGKSLKKHGAVLIVHGTLGHHRMEPVASLQNALKLQGVNSLAVTLSLGLDQRKGMYDCAIEQDHRHVDAVEEIAAWLGWLKEQGAKKIALMGHERGASQVALYMTGKKALKPLKIVKRIVLLSPLIWSDEKAGADYLRLSKIPLDGVLAKAKGYIDGNEENTLLEGVTFLDCGQARVTASAFIDYYSPNPKFNTPSLLKSISVPVLILVGSEDREIEDLTLELEKSGALNRKNIQVKQVNGADHLFLPPHISQLSDEVRVFFSSKR